MTKGKLDWKDVASTYYDKAMALAVLFLLFSFMVSPEIKVKPYERQELQDIQVIDIPEISEPQRQEIQQTKPIVEIVIEDDLGDDDDDEIEIIDTIEATSLDAWEVVVNVDEIGRAETSRFTVYDEAPVPITRIPPDYPQFAKNQGIQGSVLLDVEVYEDGTVGHVDVVGSLLAGPGGLDEAAVKAVRQWKFQPAKSNGEPIACWVSFPIEFTLRD
ncbi:MAG: energy transducer TonB [Candidatus Cloacimonetes bacterium]|nr:energy transducer TonB [Candidatus Cloacimonadota bacterium]